MTKKEFVTKEELGDSWNDMKSSLEGMQSILDRPYKYSIWITNVSFALLAFFVAVLLQMRGIGPFENKLPSQIILVAIFVPIVFGLVFRIKFEIVDLYSTLRSFFIKMQSFLNTLDEKFDDSIKSKNQIDDIKESISSVTIEKWKKRPILIGVIFQFSFFIIALLLVVGFLIKYLYC